MSDSHESTDTDTTVLAFSGASVPPYSARGLTQSLAPIDFAADMRRTINGNLKSLAPSQMQKYKSTISTGQFTDQQPPAVDGVWPGQIIAVDCISELCYLTSGGAPERAVVAGSSRVDGDFTFYRPVINFRVMTWTFTRDEYSDEVTWSMDLEEV